MKGGVTVDTKLDPMTLPARVPEAPAVDLALETGVKRVVIIGNGTAGSAAADEVRRLSSSVAIDVVTSERDRFYNRMAIGRLLYGRAAMAGLFLQHVDWASNKNINVWLNTTAHAIDGRPTR